MQREQLYVATASFADYDLWEERIIGVFDSYEQAEQAISEYVYDIHNLPPNPLTESEKDRIHSLPPSRKNIYDRWKNLKDLSNHFNSTYIKEVNLNIRENYE